MKILAIDVGQGTQDNLIYDSEKNEENFIKAVFPSPSKDFADRLSRTEGEVFVCGSQIGGGEFSHALVERAKRHRVFITEECAYTIRNDLSEVSDMGLRIVREQPSDFAGTVLHISEPDLDTIGHMMNRFGEGDPEIVAIAVQDHGTYPRGQSNRKERLRRIRENLNPMRSSVRSSLRAGRYLSAIRGCARLKRGSGRHSPKREPSLWIRR